MFKEINSHIFIMPGCLMQLIAYGAQNAYLYGNQINYGNTTFNFNSLSIEPKFLNTLDDCSICLETIKKNDVVVSCGQCIYYFHKECCSQMPVMKCPTCQKYYNNTDTKLFRIVTKKFSNIKLIKNNKMHAIPPRDSIFNDYGIKPPKKKYVDNFNKKSNRFFTKGNHCRK